jgi:LmbE family N-acetylglucosaminyl deacetylase
MQFLRGKKVLIVVAHQDDESLFFGGLLTRLGEDSPATVICMSAAKHADDAENRNGFLRNACAIVGARAITTTFREARHVWSNVDLFMRSRPEQIAAMTKFLEEQAAAIRPDVIFTHNEVGEYGHCYHKVVHRVCRRVFRGKSLYCTALGSRIRDREVIEIKYDPAQKKRLMDCYPHYDARRESLRFFGADIVYLPETFVSLRGVPEIVLPGPIAMYSALAADFLHYFYCSLRVKMGRH